MLTARTVQRLRERYAVLTLKLEIAPSVRGEKSIFWYVLVYIWSASSLI